MKDFRQQIHSMVGYWWVPLITGLICIGLGIWTFCSPVESMEVLAYAFAILFTISGVIYIGVSCATSRFNSGWGWGLAMGILEVIAGVWLLCLPAMQLTVAFMWIAGFFILFDCIGSACSALSYRGGTGWTIFSILFLLLTLFFVFVFLSNPLAGGVVVWMWLGLSLICFGVYRLVFAGQLKTLHDRTK